MNKKHFYVFLYVYYVIIIIIIIAYADVYRIFNELYNFNSFH